MTITVNTDTPRRLRLIAWALGYGLDRRGPWTLIHLTAWPGDSSDEHASDTFGLPTTLCGRSWPNVDDGRWAAEGGVWDEGQATCQRCRRIARIDPQPLIEILAQKPEAS